MKKALSLILAVMMLLGCMSITAFAAENDKTGTTTLTATKAEPFSYKISIPTKVDPITAAGVYEVGQAKATTVVSATEKTVIYYTATTTDFKLSTDESKTMHATYHTEKAATNAFPTTAVTVYKNNTDAAGIPTMWVKIADSDWTAAAAGTYTATVTFNFEVAEAVPIPAGGVYKIKNGATLSGGSGNDFPVKPADGDEYTFGDYKYTFVNDENGGYWQVTVTDKTKASYGELLDSVLGMPIALIETFKDCTNMTAAPTIPKGVKSMDSCFSGCSSLAAAPTIPAGVESMASCFYGCTSLVTAPTIPASVKDLSSCFYGCTKLAGNIKIKAENLVKYDKCFEGAGTDGDGIILKGSCTVRTELAATNKNSKVTVFNEKVIPAGGTYKVSGGDTLTGDGAIEFPETPKRGDVFTYGDYTYTYKDGDEFSGYAWVAKVREEINTNTAYGELLDSIRSMPVELEETFKGCWKMTTAPAIPEGVTSMYCCFKGCTSLVTAPTIPAGVTSMEGCFDGCNYLETAPAIPEGVTNMHSCFEGCQDLTTAPAIPASVTNMESCFHNCGDLLAAPVLPDGVEKLDSCFDSCRKITTAPAIPESVTSMDYCFNSCSKLTAAPELPAGITSLRGCFSFCSALTTAPAIPAGVTDLEDCFSSCTKITTAPAIPASVTTMYSCFSGCTALTAAPVIPAGVKDLTCCFEECEKLAGTIEINAANLEEYDDCFAGAGTRGAGITLTGSCSKLAELAATNTDGKVSVGSN